MSYLNMEHRILDLFKEESICRDLIISVSGGMDSMALMHSLLSLKKQLGLNLIIGYVHHGHSEIIEQLDYRDNSYTFLKEICGKLDLKFISNFKNKELISDKKLKSESDFREFRLKVYNLWLKKFPSYKIALGHHKNDLLENQLIQLIRGCGDKGFLSMALQSEDKVRPLIKISKHEIEIYIRAKKIEFLDDPSNHKNNYLRNWLRNTWLPSLEDYREGAVVRLASSLENISESLIDNSAKVKRQWAKVYNASRQSLDLKVLMSEPLASRLSIVAEYLRLNNASQFSQNQLKEVLKHLDTPMNSHRFKMLNLSWEIQGNEVLARQIIS